MEHKMRLIDANAFRKNIDCCDFDTYTDKQTVCDQINDAPTVDAVEVVRCKDCKHYGDSPYDNGDMMCDRWGEWIFPNDDDFCSYGERKDNG